MLLVLSWCLLSWVVIWLNISCIIIIISVIIISSSSSIIIIIIIIISSSSSSTLSRSRIIRSAPLSKVGSITGEPVAGIATNSMMIRCNIL